MKDEIKLCIVYSELIRMLDNERNDTVGGYGLFYMDANVEQ